MRPNGHYIVGPLTSSLKRKSIKFLLFWESQGKSTIHRDQPDLLDNGDSAIWIHNGKPRGYAPEVFEELQHYPHSTFSSFYFSLGRFQAAVAVPSCEPKVLCFVRLWCTFLFPHQKGMNRTVKYKYIPFFIVPTYYIAILYLNNVYVTILYLNNVYVTFLYLNNNLCYHSLSQLHTMFPFFILITYYV